MRVTQRLREQWNRQKTQMLEELDYTQSGAVRDPQSKIDTLVDIRTMELLLALPLGTTFNSQEVYAQAYAEIME